MPSSRANVASIRVYVASECWFRSDKTECFPDPSMRRSAAAETDWPLLARLRYERLVGPVNEGAVTHVGALKWAYENSDE